jgi:hypothetical protein
MTNCPQCAQVAAASAADHVPDFQTHGFAAASSAPASGPSADAQAHTATALAMFLSACVSASYDPASRKVCFSVPIYGPFCLTLPVPIPVGGQLKACVQTCGAILPTGLKVSIYANNTVIFTTTLWGTC